jgi:hypothetical protein
VQTALRLTPWTLSTSLRIWRSRSDAPQLPSCRTGRYGSAHYWLAEEDKWQASRTIQETDPFAGQPPNAARDYSRAPSDLSTAAPADRARALDGQQARYRLAFVAMEVPGLPAVVKIGPVEITQQAGPIWTQHIYIRQRPGWRPHYDKMAPDGRGAVAQSVRAGGS